MTSSEHRTGRTHLCVGAVEDRPHCLDREILRQRGDGECEQGRTAHGEDVVERVRGGDRAEITRVVDDGWEEIDREDERALVVELVDGGVVARIEPDEEVLRLRRHESAQQLLESRSGVLGRAPAGRRQIRELHLPRTVEPREKNGGGRRGPPP